MAFSLTRPSVAATAVAQTEVIGNGIVGHNNGQLYGSPAVAGPGVELKNPDLRDGKLIIAAAIQGQMALQKRVPLNTTAATPIKIAIPGVRYFRVTHFLFTNSTGVPDAGFRAGIYTLKDKGGEVLLPITQSFAGLTDDIFATLEVPVPAALKTKRAVPYLYFVPQVANAAEMFVDIHVRGEVLEWEI